MTPTYQFKLILLGDSSVGKSCLMVQYTQRQFTSDHGLTIGLEFGSRELQLGTVTVRLQIWDTVWEMGAAAALLVYDVTNRASFQSVSGWLQEIRSNGSSSAQLLLVGNKIDLKKHRVVTYAEGKDFARQNGLLFLETSALTGENVEEAFFVLSSKVLARINCGDFDLANEVRIPQNYGIKVAKQEESKSDKQQSRECYYCNS